MTEICKSMFQSITRRVFLAFCGSAVVFFPRLYRGAIARAEDDLIIVDGWILRRSDLEGPRQ